MSTKDIWYGMLEAGEKSSPVVRDATLDASQGKVWLYNHLRNEFVEYAKAIVEPKLRELNTEDIPQRELDEAFRAARGAFSSSGKVSAWSETKPAAPPVKKKVEEDDLDIDVLDEGDMVDFDDYDD
jgi:hypothetical protein